MMLADQEYIDSQRISEYRLIQGLPNSYPVGGQRPMLVFGYISECVKSELDVWHSNSPWREYAPRTLYQRVRMYVAIGSS